MIGRTVERQGARIAYSVSGPEGAPALLLGHSLFCDQRMWEGVAPRLAERFRVFNIDARGHGGSSAPGPFTLEDLAADWLAILDVEKIPRAACCGLSMGGMTAMRLALAAPDRVRGLVLLDTSADREEPARNRLQYRIMAKIIRRFGHIDAFYGIARRKLLGKTTRRERPELADLVIARLKELDPKQLYEATNAVFGRPSIHGQIASLRLPTLILVGEEDVATPLIRSERIAAAIPGALLRTLPRAGHLSALETPDAVTREVGEFVAALPS